ncbi:MAG TPA: response regulator [Terriglobales bacterium]|nr:response regulator [Terriglobales bacterium]
MTKPRVLVVEDDDAVRTMLKLGLERDGFEVVVAANVSDALGHIARSEFDALLSDLHMPLAGDGFTVVSAMRHTHPEALTIVLSGYPALEEAMSAILAQADEILAKPIRIGLIKELIHARLGKPHVMKRIKPESVASILERESETTVKNWLNLVEQNAELTCIPLSRHERTGHLPKLLRDVILRLRLDSEMTAPISLAARDHGEIRRQQGYTAPMLVEESRILQVSIFSTLQRSLSSVDFSKVLLDVVTIADEVDSQLKQAMLCYVTSTPVLRPRKNELAG